MTVSWLDADLLVEGELSGSGAVVIEGAVRGPVNVDKVVVGAAGRVDGPVTAREIQIDGTVRGDVVGESVTIGASARVVGNVTHTMIVVAPGAEIDGRRPWRPPGHVATG